MRIGWWLMTLLLVPGCSSSGWVVEQSQTSETLYAVYGLSASDVFAVGTHGTALHRRDGVWHALNTGTQEDLFAVWGSDESHVVVVGNNGIALGFIGDEPATDADPPPASFTQLSIASGGNFRDIDGVRSDLALAVGEGRMQRYNGSQLTNDTPTCAGRILGVSMIAEGQAFAVGEDGVFCSLQNNTWNTSIIKLCAEELVDGICPPGKEISPVLWDVWVGSEGTGAVVGMNGGIWPYPPPTDTPWLPLELNFSGDLRSIDGWVDEQAGADKTELFVVGDNGEALRMRGGTIYREFLDVRTNLYGVWVSPDGHDVYIVGAEGTIVHRER
jgi:hypothetical protein